MKKSLNQLYQENRDLREENRDLKKRIIQLINIHEDEKRTDEILKIIQQTICIFYGTPEIAFFSRSKKREIAIVRQIYCYFSRSITGFSYDKIGDFIDRDHATVLHAIRTIGNMMKFNKNNDYIKQIPVVKYVLRKKNILQIET